MRRSVVFPFFLSFALLLVDAELQFVRVKGRVKCEGQPVQNASVQLWDFDWGSLDEKLDERRTDAAGGFEVGGQEDEWRVDFWRKCETSGRKMKAYLEIRHTCTPKKDPACTLYDFGRQFAKCAKPKEADDLGDIELTRPFFDGKRRQTDGCW
ncbi:Transthyretin-like family-containing protein [Aphelenchoides fujianensis]|nr:Transthyretin-like family-containing protein [Aphelenchoides fujianensis]